MFLLIFAKYLLLTYLALGFVISSLTMGQLVIAAKSLIEIE